MHCHLPFLIRLSVNMKMKGVTITQDYSGHYLFDNFETKYQVGMCPNVNHLLFLLLAPSGEHD